MLHLFQETGHTVPLKKNWEVTCMLSNIKLEIFVSQESPCEFRAELWCKWAKHQLETWIFGNDGSEISEVRQQLFLSVFDFQRFAEIAPMAPSDDQAACAHGHMVSFFAQYQGLNQMAKACKSRWCQMVLWIGILSLSVTWHFTCLKKKRFLNCKFNYNSEDLVGRIATLGRSVVFLC